MRIGVFVLLLSAASLHAQDTTWVVVPGVRFGPVSAASTLTQLQQKLGAANAKADSLDVGEGIVEPGVVLFPQDSTRRAYLYWLDTLGFTRPSAVVLRDRGSRWRLPQGIHIGTTLAELERINGRPFTFSGFGWDYGGRASGWSDGALAHLMGPGMSFGVTLYPTCQEAMAPSAYESILGDKELQSTDPVVQSACIVVDEIWMGFVR
jgi:hypothetical protein